MCYLSRLAVGLWMCLTPTTAGSPLEAQSPPAWSLSFRYGGGSPNDAGPLGHCTATFTSDGKVRIESKGRKGVSGPRDVLVLEQTSLPGRQLEELAKAADAALKESAYSRLGENQDGVFLRLERQGESPARVVHRQMKDFAEAPPAMRSFVLLVNDLLPEKERIPLKKTQRGSRD